MPVLRSTAAAHARAAALACAAALLAACERDAATEPTPRPTRSVCGSASRPPGSAGCVSVAGYLDSALTLMQGFSINRSVDWPSFRDTFRTRGAGLASYAATYPVIQDALETLDPHSSISPPNRLPGSTDAPSDREDLRVQSRLLDGRLGYVWVPGFVGRSQQGRADTTHAALRALDASDPCGWVLDLRANSGGFVYGLMASVGPLYASGAGETRVGGQRYNDGYQVLWYYKQLADGRDFFGMRDARDSSEMRVPNPWRPRRPGLPVAVLHSTGFDPNGRLTSITASAGEQITLAVRGGPPSRSFGLPTYGVASGRAFFFMPDSARIDITDSFMFDRLGYTPGLDPIPPDTTIVSPVPLRIAGDDDPVITAARQWLLRQPACSGGAAATGPRLDRAPAARPAAPPLRASMPTDARRRVPSLDARYGTLDEAPGATPDRAPTRRNLARLAGLAADR